MSIYASFNTYRYIYTSLIIDDYSLEKRVLKVPIGMPGRQKYHEICGLHIWNMSIMLHKSISTVLMQMFSSIGINGNIEIHWCWKIIRRHMTVAIVVVVGVVVVNFISDRQYNNKDRLLTKQIQHYCLLSEATREAHRLIELVAWKFTCSSGNPGLSTWGLK